MDGRAGVDAKFGRARQRSEELLDAMDEWFRSNPVELRNQRQVSHGVFKSQIFILKPPPIELALLTGEAVHNARSALDHLAWRLVEVGGGTPGRHTQFPIVDNISGKSRKVRDRLKGAKKEAIDAVIALQPWEGGNADLWLTSQIDNCDKHRMLLPTIPSAGSLAITTTLGTVYLSESVIEEARDGDWVEHYSEDLMPEPAYGSRMVATRTLRLVYPSNTPAAGMMPWQVTEVLERVEKLVEPLTASVA